MAEALLEKKNAETEYFEDDVSQFLHDIRRYPLLTAEEELALAKKCAQGDEQAIRTMVNCNLRLVVSIAKEYAGRGVPLLDLIQEGSIGLLSAARNYDYTQNCRFSTYARQWIRQGVDRGVLNHGGLIRVPLHKMELIRKVMAIRTALAQETGEEPLTEAIAQRADMPLDKVEQLLEMAPKVSSLDAPAGEDGNVQQILENLQATQPYEELIRSELKHTLDLLLSLLPERQSLVLRLHFGLEDGVCHSLEDIGKMLNVSKQRAAQIEQQAMEKLQKLGAGLGLEEFLQ